METAPSTSLGRKSPCLPQPAQCGWLPFPHSPLSMISSEGSTSELLSGCWPRCHPIWASPGALKDSSLIRVPMASGMQLLCTSAIQSTVKVCTLLNIRYWAPRNLHSSARKETQVLSQGCCRPLGQMVTVSAATGTTEVLRREPN